MKTIAEIQEENRKLKALCRYLYLTLELGLTEDQVYAFIQGYSVAYDRLSGLGPL